MKRSMASNPPNVFLDASVLFAATLSATGSARDLINCGFRDEYELILSSDVIEECERNLAAKAPAALPRLTAFVTLLVHRAEPSEADVQRAAAVVVAKDAPVVAGAVAAQAQFLATYDRKHLLSKRQAILAAFGITVATPDEILRQL